MVKEQPTFYKNQSVQPATCPYPKPHSAKPHLRIIFKTEFNIILPPMPRSSKYSGECYNEQMIQRTVFINKIRMLQRTRRNNIGRRSKRMRMTCSIKFFTRERLFVLFMCVRLLMLFIGKCLFIVFTEETLLMLFMRVRLRMLFIRKCLFIVFTKEALFMLFMRVRLRMLFIRKCLFIVFTKETLFMFFKFTCTVYKS